MSIGKAFEDRPETHVTEGYAFHGGSGVHTSMGSAKSSDPEPEVDLESEVEDEDGDK